MAQRNLLGALWWPMWEGKLEGVSICVCLADSLCCTPEAGTTL